MSDAGEVWRHRTVQAREPGQWDDLWRPDSWRQVPEQPQHRTLALVAVVGLLVYANVIVNEVLDPAWYVPFNVAVMGTCVFVVRATGATWISLGLRTDRVARGVRVGLAFGAVAVLAVVAASLLPVFDEAFADERVTEGSFGLALYHSLIRIPVGTALYEEVIFRGVLFGVLSRRFSFLSAALVSSVLFGLWHVLPTIDTTRTNPAADLFGADVVTVVLGVAATTVIGLAFVWLRGFGRSIATPVIVHLAFNSTAVVVAAVMADLS